MKFKLKGIVVKTLLIILSLSFIIFGMINFFVDVGQTNILKVGDKRININMFAKFLTEKRNQVYQADLSEEELAFYTSKTFINISLSEFINEILFQNKIKQLNLEEPKKAVLDEIYNDSNFKNKNGKFDISILNSILEKNSLSEEMYVQYISSYNTRNNLLQILTLQKLYNKSFIEPLFLKSNEYIIADIIEIKPSNLKFKMITPTNDEVENYYKSNINNFVVPEEKIISYIEIDLGKYKEEEAKLKLSELEDSILSSKNIDEVASKFNIEKNIIKYSQDNKNISQDLTNEILQYSTGTFSDLIYKDNNVYKVYYIEKVLPSKILTLNEATPKVLNILLEKSKKENDLILLNKMIKQLKYNNISNVVSRNGDKLIKNQIINRTTIEYPDELVEELYSLNSTSSITKPIFDLKNNLYYLAVLKETKEIKENDNRFVSFENIQDKINRLYSNSIIKLFQQDLFNTEKVIINTDLLNSLE